MATFSASEVQVSDIPPKIRTLPTLPRDVLLIEGTVPWGPINESQFVIDFDDYFKKYRGFTLDSEVALQVRQFFLGGGRKAIVNRVVHVDVNGDPVSAVKSEATLSTAAGAPTKGSVTGSIVAPYALVSGDTLIGDVDGVGNQTLTILGTAAAIESGAVETYGLFGGETLTVKIDGGAVQTVTFAISDFAAPGFATPLHPPTSHQPCHSEELPKAGPKNLPEMFFLPSVCRRTD